VGSFASWLLLAVASAGLPDRGIFPELTERVNLAAAERAADARVRVDPAHGLVTLYDGDDPVKLYKMADPTAFTHSGGFRDHVTAGLTAADARELLAAAGDHPRILEGAPARDEDRDGDGIVDRLDILVGAKKLLANGARYYERYVVLRYPGGDVPRSEGVCTDTVIRALRNAGIDLQREVHEDILRAPSAYPMVGKVDANINHRRVKTLLPWFTRHWRLIPRGEKYQPGDVLFFDTFPTGEGPEHVGVVSDGFAATGNRLIVNNWTVGASDAEMDLLSFVPVTHHFRLPPSGGKSQSR
jgi:uncharacterized protein YijF (DUF1287 family)